MYLIPLCLVLLDVLLSTNAQMIRDGRFFNLRNRPPFLRFPPIPPPGSFNPRFPFPQGGGTLRGAINQPRQFWPNNRNDRAIPGRQTSDFRNNPNNRPTGQNIVRPPFGAVQQPVPNVRTIVFRTHSRIRIKTDF